jgi:hypothetical protein
MFMWLNGWKPFVEETQRQDLERELARELAGNTRHALSGCRAVAVAWCGRGDDIILRLDSSEDFAYIHLTWNPESQPDWPYCECLSGVEMVNRFIADWQQEDF